MDRRALMTGLLSTAAVAACGGGGVSKPTRMPVLFAGHGSPMNAIEANQWASGFGKLAEGVPRPKAILAISAHWYTRGLWVTSNVTPPTIHDFSGFPKALHEVQYPAPGKPELADQVRGLLGADAGLRSDWGLDHGTWSVLRRMYPEAEIPVLQLSLDRNLTGEQHLAVARSLQPLREEGVLILGSGNVVHNLRDAIGHMRSGDLRTPEWAARYDSDVAKALEQRDAKAILARNPATAAGRQAHPSPDHWLPLLYALGASDDRDTTSFPVEGFDWGSLSMRSVRFS